MNDNGDKPEPVTPNDQNTIGMIFLYMDPNYGVNVMFQNDPRKFPCDEALSENIMKEAANHLLGLLKANNLFGFEP